MATLVLTTVGGIVGGPIGAAIGGILGQAVDRDVLFRPKGRQGPRLTDLSVQTSSYGWAIPRLFGTLRVAGSVIWSTDLIESRSTEHGGKGQPDVTSYSYSVSFAVLLSARSIRGVKRIWADGNLLRGAGGDFKTATGFRLHPGGEDQEVDPLIASAEGVGLAPAHRGCAYAVFENFQLADYGNRIPSLTFEIEADADAVPAGAIAAELSGGLIDGTAATLPIAGFSAYGDTVRAVLDTLATASGGWFAPAGGVLEMRSDGAASATVRDDGYAASGGGGATSTRSIAPLASVPKAVAIGYYDGARDYQTGLQRARRPGAGNTERTVDMPAVLSAGAAKTLAEAILARAETGREARKVALGWDALGIAPGTVVAIAGEAGRWRVTGWSLETMVLGLDLVRLAAAPLPASASAGRVLASPDRMIGTTIVHAFEAPPLDDDVLAAPRLLIAAAGTAPGWRKAALLLSADDGASWTAIGGTAAPAVIGALASVPDAASAWIEDRRSAFEVELAHDAMLLVDADDAALRGGANLALVGDELLQFARAEPLGGTRWRLSRLWRGRRGTEAAIGAQRSGDRFVLIERDCVAVAELPVSAIGGTVRILASGVGDVDGPASCDAPVSGASVLPASPVHLRAGQAADGSVTLTWVRRSRAGWRWIDGADAPLAEERELYRVTIADGNGMRTVETDAPALTLAVDRAAAPTTISVRQAGLCGESAAAAITLAA
ncbi:MAG TPA: phage tail protein [Sphingomonas sp.]|nr:phage tail protein [Sphingomonas sp.]